ncbi:hypothetical protein WKH27_23215 [Pantoea agglomerans]|uniref:hypothetical protein n=1 Tax=Enterobacter agglomerans TaxID=549 RepID=UPI002896E8F0|nr:hypothetical protein [Pantoea agglomerans]WNK56162.1 hypothetical protein RM154_23515 [Pantoea agglomerans]
MKEINSEKRYYYAHATHNYGTRPFLGIEMIISNMIDNFKEVTSHSNGSFSTTKDRIGRNAISDTATVMSYSLLEGFFDEEYDFYIKKEGSKKPGELSALINTVLRAHGITLKNWRKRREIIDLVKDIRNAVVHSNGRIDGHIYKEKFLKILGVDFFEHTDGYLTLTFDASLWLINAFEAIAREYAEVVFFRTPDPKTDKSSGV